MRALHTWHLAQRWAGRGGRSTPEGGPRSPAVSWSAADVPVGGPQQAQQAAPPCKSGTAGTRSNRAAWRAWGPQRNDPWFGRRRSRSSRHAPPAVLMVRAWAAAKPRLRQQRLLRTATCKRAVSARTPPARARARQGGHARLPRPANSGKSRAICARSRARAQRGAGRPCSARRVKPA